LRAFVFTRANLYKLAPRSRFRCSAKYIVQFMTLFFSNGINLVTENVDQHFDRALKAGAIKVLQPEAKPWGQIVSYVKDNNGCLVEICSPIGS